MDPAQVFTVIGLLSCLIFVPVLLLPEPQVVSKPHHAPLRRQIQVALKAGSKTPAVWISGGLDATVYVATYALKAFLPIYGLSLGMSIVEIGVFFSIQEATSMILKPIGGRLGDRWGHLRMISLGMLLFGMTVPLLTWAPNGLTMMILAGTFGAAQALVFPSTTALVSTKIDPQHLGAGMGLSGALDNAGKVMGPILGGILINQFDFALTLQLMGLMLLFSAGLVWLRTRLPHGHGPRRGNTIALRNEETSI
jgi:MFS family permease